MLQAASIAAARFAAGSTAPFVVLARRNLPIRRTFALEVALVVVVRRVDMVLRAQSFVGKTEG